MQVNNILLDSQSQAVFNLGVVTPAATAAASCVEQTFTVPATMPPLRVTDLVEIAFSGGSGNSVVAAQCRVVSATQIAIQFCNPTAGSLTHAASTAALPALLVVTRP